MYETIESLNKDKQSLAERFKNCKKLSAPLAKAHASWLKVQRKADNNPSRFKFEVRASELRSEFDSLLKEAYGAYLAYKKTVEDIDQSYSKIIFNEQKRSARRKLEKEADKFKSEQQKLLPKLDNIYLPYQQYFAPKEEPNKDTEDASQTDMKMQLDAAYTQPYYMPPYYMPPYPYQAPPQVNTAPVNIDISPIVENAVKSAMEKFTSVLSSRIDAYSATLPELSVNKSNDSVSLGSAETIVETAGKIADDEQFVLDKLLALLENIKGVTEQLSELAAACNELGEKQRTASESVRRVNDMQRTLSRELQGVQAKQKIINQDQMSVTEEQHVVYEHQKTALERQNIISEAQKSVSDAQLTVMENQKLLEKSVRDLLGTKDSGIGTKQKPRSKKEAKPTTDTKSEAPAAAEEPQAASAAPELKEPESEPIELELDKESGKDKLSELAAEE